MRAASAALLPARHRSALARVARHFAAQNGQQRFYGARVVACPPPVGCVAPLRGLALRRSMRRGRDGAWAGPGAHGSACGRAPQGSGTRGSRGASSTAGPSPAGQGGAGAAKVADTAAGQAARAQPRGLARLPRGFGRLIVGSTLASMAISGAVVAYVWAWEPSEEQRARYGVRAGTEEAGQAVRLGDGRLLGIKVYGDPHGRPVLLMHGPGGSRLEPEALGEGVAHAVASQLGVCLVATERPGYGVSTPVPERTLSDWPADVIAIADAIGARQFAVAGISNGGAYALACAHALPASHPGRLTGVALVAADGPHIGEGVPLSDLGKATASLAQMFERGPEMVQLSFRLLRRSMFTSPEEYVDSVVRLYGACPADAAAVREVTGGALPTPTSASASASAASTSTDAATAKAEAEAEADRERARRLLLLSAWEGMRRGADGLVRDLQLQYVAPWPFKLSEVRLPAATAGRVHVWHGRRDPVVDVANGEYLERHVPGAIGHITAEDGHVSLLRARLREVLHVAAARTPSLAVQRAQGGGAAAAADGSSDGGADGAAPRLVPAPVP